MSVNLLLLAPVFIVAFSLGYWASSFDRRQRTPPSLPCPHMPCRNRLPRQGAYTKGTRDWGVEECAVCLGKVQFVPFYPSSHNPHPEDRYIRIHSEDES